MRYDLAAAPPEVALPAGVTVTPWTDDLASRFFAAYEASFRDRPGFPGWPQDTWVDWTASDDEFRADWSLLATDGDDLGFITAGEGWIVQVGVRPEARGRAIGAGLGGRVDAADARVRWHRGAAGRQRRQPGRRPLPAARLHHRGPAGALLVLGSVHKLPIGRAGPDDETDPRRRRR